MSGEGGTVRAAVCIAHGRFVPCRKQGEHRTTDNPYWVKAVRDYQCSPIEGLTWEPAWSNWPPVPDDAEGKA
jgi:hypothetical protein